jgi:biotin carboxylase
MNQMVSATLVANRCAETSIGVSTRQMNVVVLCHLGRAGYNIQRALASLGAKTYLISDERSGSMRFSRGCSVLHHVPGNIATADENHIIKLINDTHEQVGIASVIPADVDASLYLTRIRDRLYPAIFPTAPSETLARLNDKWEFAKICMAEAVPIPNTLFFANNASVDPIAVRETLGFPVIVKPATGFGQRGIDFLIDDAAVEKFISLHTHDTGMVIQEFIQGRDWSLSVFALDGVVKNWTAWECPSQLETTYGVSRFMATKFRHHDGLIAMAEKVVAATHFSGVANFDARLSDDGRMVLFECNPRFFNRMLAARICGLNFVAAGLPSYALRQKDKLCNGDYYPWQELFTKRGLPLLLSGEWKLKYLLRDVYEMLRDPIPPLVRKFTREDEKAN